MRISAVTAHPLFYLLAKLNPFSGLFKLEATFKSETFQSLTISKELAASVTVEQEFRDYYREHLVEVLTSIEKKRTRDLQRAKRIFASGKQKIALWSNLSTLFLFITIWLLLSYGTWIGALGLVYCVLSLKDAKAVVPKTFGVYKTRRREELIGVIARFFNDDFKFLPPGIGPLKKRFEDHEILPCFDAERSEDGIVGTYRGSHIEIGEFHFHNLKQSKGNVYRKLKVSGLVFYLEVEKVFYGKTILQMDKAPSISGHAQSLVSWMSGSTKNLESVRLEDPRFEAQFDVFSSDQVEARYLLSPELMVRFLELQKTYRLESVSACFLDKHLLLILPTKKKLFELDSQLQSFEYDALVVRIYRELKTLLTIVDDLCEGELRKGDAVIVDS